MPRPPRRLGALSLALAGALGLSACGVATTTTSTPATSPGAATATPTASDTATPTSSSAAPSATATPSIAGSATPGAPSGNLHPGQGELVDAAALFAKVRDATRAEKRFQSSFTGENDHSFAQVDLSEPGHPRAAMTFADREHQGSKPVPDLLTLTLDGPDLYMQVAPNVQRFRKIPFAKADPEVRAAAKRLIDPVSALDFTTKPGDTLVYGGDQAGNLLRYVTHDKPNATGGPPARSHELWVDSRMRIYLVQDMKDGAPDHGLHMSQFGRPVNVFIPPASLVVN